MVFSAAFHSKHPHRDTIAPADPHIRYVGRFDFQDPKGPRCAWSASSVQIDFWGTDLRVRISDGGQNQFQVVVDGIPTAVLKLQKGEAEYVLTHQDTPGAHTVQLVKRTEVFPGITQFLGFELEGTLIRSHKPTHVIEVIGDSISCGYGDEGKTKEEHFSVNTENAYMTYGALAARALDADFIDIAWSGRMMWPSNSIPEIYDLALPPDKNSAWDLSQQTPDVIVINLATNDFGKVNPDEKQWTEAYSAFIDRLRKRAPNARVYCCIGPMMTDNWPPKTHALSTVRAYIREVVHMRQDAGDNNVALLEFETQNLERDGIGSDWHPNLKTHQNMADRLVKAIQADLGWTTSNR
jgi:lysophospholipase L1-like esterase